MMRKMRNHMKWIMLLTAISFVALMVFGWGMDISGRSNTAATGGDLGRVNGEPITVQEWQTLVRSMTEEQQRASNAPIGGALNQQIEDAAWERLIMQKLVNQELDRRGISVSNAELLQAAREEPPPEFRSNEFFQTNGQFDISKYHAFMATPQANDELLLQLEGYYRELIPRSKLFFQITTGAYLPVGELWRLWRDARETVRVKYAFFDPNTLVPDERVTIEPREIERYYREHKTEFERPAHARIRYIVIDRTPTAQDTADALARAQRIRAELAAPGAKFEEIAKRESVDSISGQQGGSLGKVTKGRTAPAFETALFSLPVGQLSQPVQTQFGYHIIQVQKRMADTAEARHVLIPIRPSPQREEELLSRADSLDDLGGDGPLDEAGRKLGLTVRESELEPGLAFVPGVGQIDDGANWVFEDALVNEVSEVFETPTAFYIIQVIEKTETGTMTLEEAKPIITARLKQQKKLELARDIARQALDKVRGGMTLEQAAQSVGAKVEEAGPFTRLDFVPGLGRANAAIGTAFGQKPGQISDVVEAEGALFIIQTLEKVEANRKEWEAQRALQSTRIAQAMAEQRWTQYLQALKGDAKIVDNRATLLSRADTAAVR